LMFYNGNDMGVDGFGLAIAALPRRNGGFHARD